MAKKKKSDLLYIMNPNCGWCKKADPVVDELNKDGHKITTLNVTDATDGKKASEVKSKYNLQCGTPLFIDAETGNSVCGFRDKEILSKWANGEEIPAPAPRPDRPAAPVDRMMKLEYIWVDGEESKSVRSKVKFQNLKIREPQNNNIGEIHQQIMGQIPDWSFDGSSTNQAKTENSDLILKPVKIYPNVMNMTQKNSMPSWFVFCEVYNTDNTPHESNSRDKLKNYIEDFDNDLAVAFEQEYVFWNDKYSVPAGWEGSNEPTDITSPSKEGSYYCGSGGDVGVFRNLVETHVTLCRQSMIHIEGYNAEVLKSQWEYQTQPKDVLRAADDLWMSRFILTRIAETRGLGVSFDPKPVEGNNNGSGCHLNFSNSKMRNEESSGYIDAFCEELAVNHDTAISVSGFDNSKRLTGKNETSSYDKFTYGKSDRSASVRLPLNGDYIEDRRPAANVDPYEILLNLCEITNEVNEKTLIKA